MFKTPAIRFVQNGRHFYTTAIPAAELIQLSKVDVWSEGAGSGGSQRGYQRAPSTARKREIAHYVAKNDSIMPIGGLVNSRAKAGEEIHVYGKNLTFEPHQIIGEVAVGTLHIPEDGLPLFVVDMQHRLGGFEYAINEEGIDRLKSFPLPVTIADGLSLMEEVDQFDLINTTQKKVRTDLARRLKVIQAKDVDRRLQMDQEGSLWEAKGPVIASTLNKLPGVWQGRIVPPNAGKAEYPAAIIKETSFVTSLKPILQTPYFSRLPETHAAELIRRFWEAVARIFPAAAMSAAEDHVLLKTPGVFSMHAIAPEVFELARDKGADITADTLYSVLKSLKDMGLDDTFWAKESDDGAALYGSMKGFKILASKLRHGLPDLTLRIS